MTYLETLLSPYRPQFLSILRIMTALLFLAHGTSKLFGWPATGMTPPLDSLGGIAGIIELIGGILLVLGFLTRPVAFILAGEMAVAYFMAHAPASFFPILNQGESAVLFCFVFLYLVFAGAGVWSIDHARKAA